MENGYVFGRTGGRGGGGVILFFVMMVIAVLLMMGSVASGGKSNVVVPPQFATEFQASVSLKLHNPLNPEPYMLAYNVTQSMEKLMQVYEHPLNALGKLRTLGRYDMTPPMLYVVTEYSNGSATCSCDVSEYLVPIPELHAWRSTVPVRQRSNVTINGHKNCRHFVQKGVQIDIDTLSAFFCDDTHEDEMMMDEYHELEASYVPVHTVYHYPPLPDNPKKLLFEFKNFSSVSIGTPDDDAFAVPSLCMKSPHCNATTTSAAAPTSMTPLQLLMSAVLLRDHQTSSSPSALDIVSS